METCALSDTQHKLASKLLEDLDYDLSQIFWGSECNLEWSIEQRIEGARKVLLKAISQLPEILTL